MKFSCAISLIWTALITAPLVIFRKTARLWLFAARRLKKANLKKKKAIWNLLRKSAALNFPSAPISPVKSPSKMTMRMKMIRQISAWPAWKPRCAMISWKSWTGFLKILDGSRNSSKCSFGRVSLAKKCASRRPKNMMRFKSKSSLRLKTYSSIMRVSKR